MSIGQTGKQAQNFGQQRQNQYQLDYSQADSFPLNPPRRRLSAKAQSTVTREAPIQRTAQPSHPSVTQKTGTPENKAEQLQTPEIIQREVAIEDVETSSDSGNDLAQDVADRVFKMMLADVKKDRERSGGRFR